MADDKQERIETLQDRVDELEATVSKMLPSRRDALKLGAAGAVGAVGMAGSASAQNSGQTGTIGTDADRVDVNAEDIDAVSVNTEEVEGTADLTSTAVWTLFDGANNNLELRTKETQVVADNSATPILSVGSIGDDFYRAFKAVVVGQEDGSNAPVFKHTVDVASGEETSVISRVSRKTPPTDSYSVDFSDLSLALDGSGETFNIICYTIGGGFTA